MANTDIRISIGFWDHPKTVKLERRAGLEGVKALLMLWQWVAQYEPSGYLYGMDEEGLEIAARWQGESGKLAKTLLELKFIDPLPDGPGYSIQFPPLIGRSQARFFVLFTILHDLCSFTHQIVKVRGCF